MNAIVKELWLIVECPKCMRPQVVNKYVKDNAVINLLRPRYVSCSICSTNFFVELEELNTDLDRPPEKEVVVNMG
jgi:transcription elongation factor Elf1